MFLFRSDHMGDPLTPVAPGKSGNAEFPGVRFHRGNDFARTRIFEIVERSGMSRRVVVRCHKGLVGASYLQPAPAQPFECSKGSIVTEVAVDIEQGLPVPLGHDVPFPDFFEERFTGH